MPSGLAGVYATAGRCHAASATDTHCFLTRQMLTVNRVVAVVIKVSVFLSTATVQRAVGQYRVIQDEHAIDSVLAGYTPCVAAFSVLINLTDSTRRVLYAGLTCVNSIHVAPVTPPHPDTPRLAKDISNICPMPTDNCWRQQSPAQTPVVARSNPI
jgi:hypothetical protein